MAQPSENSLIPSFTAPELRVCEVVRQLTAFPLMEDLTCAVLSQNYEIALSLLSEVIADPRFSTESIGHLVEPALQSGNYDLYSKICEASCSPNMLEPSNFETLVRSDNTAVIKFLAITYPDVVRKLANPEGTKYEPLIHIAVKTQSIEIVKILLEFTTRKTALRFSSNSVSLLTEAAIRGSDYVELLISHPYFNDLIKVASTEDHQAWTALHYATLYCEYPTFKKLYDVCIVVDSFCDLLEEAACTVLIFMMEPENEERVKQFIKDLGPNHPLLTEADSHGQTPLHMAAYYGYREVVDMLYTIYLAEGLVLAGAGEYDHTFFNYLIYGNHIGIIENLLKREDFDSRLVSVPDNSNRSPLMNAIANGRVEICELLYPISVSSGTIAVPYKKGINVLMAAVGNGLLPVVEILTSEPKVRDVLMVRMDDGHSPLHHAVHTSSPEICALIYERSTIEQICLRNKAWGLTALHWAILYRGTDMIEPLLKDRVKARALIEVKDVDGLTAMDYAQARSPEITAMLEAVMSV